jgi:siroheme synthase
VVPGRAAAAKSISGWPCLVWPVTSITARPGTTLAVYMGIATLPRLRDGLHAAGLPHTTPAALIEAGGTPRQRVLHGTLDRLVAAAPGWTAGGPVLLLVGEVVGRGTALSGSVMADGRRPALADAS